MELLAPAGTMENFMAALEAGADAIFLGGKAFGARAKAANFGRIELEMAVRMAHLLGVAVHVTVNILIGDQELADVKLYLKELEEVGVDAIIVQDLAVAQLAKEVAPNLELHASTQLTVTNLATIRFFEEMGFSRIVLARELSLQEIEYLCSRTKLEIEAFIHGALCICYSGQCLMSSFIGGRSGNRGACAQPCRLPYELLNSAGERQTKEAESYLLSPKDLNYSEHIADLLNAGVASFKVEGRMKKVSYVRQVIGTYRSIIDSHGKVSLKDLQNLEEGFNRGFSTAYLKNNPGREMMTIVAPNNQGKKIGEAKRQGLLTLLELIEPAQKGDLLKIISKEGQVNYLTIDESWKRQDDYHFSGKVKEGALEGIVYLAASARHKQGFRGLADFNRKYPVYAYLDGQEGEKVSLTLLLEDGLSVTVYNDYVLQRAKKVPTTHEKVENQLNRLGNTVFFLKNLSMPDGEFMWPVSVLNELRREAVTTLERAILERYEEGRQQKLAAHRKYYETVKNTHTKGVSLKQEISPKAKSLYSKPIVSARLDELWQVPVAITGGAKKIIFGGDRLQREPYSLDVYAKVVETCKKANVYITVAMPRVVREQESKGYYEHLNAIVAAGPDAIAINFLGGFIWLRDLDFKGDIEGDTGLNIFNSNSLAFLADLGFSSLAVSQEATLHQIKQMSRKVEIPLETLVQGQTELMISEYCAIGSFLGNGGKQNCPRPCLNDQFTLKDRKNESFPLRTDPYCRMHIMNSRELDLSPYVDKLVKQGVKILRLDLRQRSKEDIYDKISLYKNLLNGSVAIPDKMLTGKVPITRGHYFKGIFE